MEWLKTIEQGGKALNVATEPVILLEEGQLWYDSVADVTASKKELTPKEIALIESKVSAWLESEVKRYNKYKVANPSSDSKWVKDIIRSGTHSDKVAALSLLISESPVHSLQSLDTLIASAFKKEQRSAILALEALKDLFITNLLPDRHLIPLKLQDWSKVTTLKSALLKWYEAQLLLRVDKYVDAIEAALKSNVDFFKKRALELAVEMLSSKPEKESRLLRLIVNKLGDPSKSICAKAMEVLKGLLRSHPSMKVVVVREVRQLVYWANQSLRIVYVCCVFLTQIPLKAGDSAVCAELVECFMGLFEKAVAQGEVGSRLLSVLLNGVNRAYPFLADVAPLTTKIDSLFKIVHTASFAATTQALLLISLIALHDDTPNNNNNSLKLAAGGGKEKDKGKDKEAATDESKDLRNRYYRALYSKLVDEQVATKSRNTVFFNLLYRSLKRDNSVARCAAFIKKLLLMSAHAKPTVATALMLMISEVCKGNREIGKILDPIDKCRLAKLKESSQPQAQAKAQAQGDDDDDDASAVGSSNGRSGNGGMFDGLDINKREPLFACSASTTGLPNLWELSLHEHHFHPSVRAFATQLRGPSHTIAYNGDPTQDFSVKAFLDRFAYKNPKQKKGAGAGAMTDVDSKHADMGADGEDPINLSSELLGAGNIEDVDPEKRFFFKYFNDREQLRAEGRSRNRSRRQQGAGQDDDAGSEAGDVALDREEEEMDAFADKLAEDLMTSAAGNYGDDDDADVDIDDFDEDDFDEDEDDEDGEQNAGFMGARARRSGDHEGEDDDDSDMDAGMFDTAAGEGSDDDDEGAFEDDEEENDALDLHEFVASKKGNKGKGSSSSSGKQSSYQLAAYNENDDADLAAVSKKKRKAKASSRKDEDSEFADAADYEEEMEAIVNQYATAAAAAAPGAAGKKGKPNKIKQQGLYSIGGNQDDDEEKQTGFKKQKRRKH